MQTENFDDALTRLDISSIKVALDSHLLPADSVRFEPVNFRKTNRTIIEAHIGNPFRFRQRPIP